MNSSAIDVGRALVLWFAEDSSFDEVGSRLRSHPVLSKSVAVWREGKGESVFAPASLGPDPYDSLRTLVQKFVNPALRRDDQIIRFSDEQLLFVTSSSSDKRLVVELKKNVEEILSPHQRVWIHFEKEGDLTTTEVREICGEFDGNFLLYVVKQKTPRQEHLELGSYEMSAIPFQWLEHAVLRSKNKISNSKKKTAAAKNH